MGGPEENFGKPVLFSNRVISLQNRVQRNWEMPCAGYDIWAVKKGGDNAWSTVRRCCGAAGIVPMTNPEPTTDPMTDL